MKYIKLFESFSDGKIFCYHGAGSKTSDWKDIVRGNFKIGTGSNYGPGIYTFYNLDDINSSLYGTLPVIIEFEISDFNGFYVEDREVALDMFNEYNLTNQVENIMGKSWIMDNPEKMEEIIEDPQFGVMIMNSDRFDRRDPLEIKQSKWIYGKELKGSIFNTPDGLFCVIHDINVAKPNRFSLDGGITWENASKIK